MTWWTLFYDLTFEGVDPLQCLRLVVSTQPNANRLVKLDSSSPKVWGKQLIYIKSSCHHHLLWHSRVRLGKPIILRQHELFNINKKCPLHKYTFIYTVIINKMIYIYTRSDKRYAPFLPSFSERSPTFLLSTFGSPNNSSIIAFVLDEGHQLLAELTMLGPVVSTFWREKLWCWKNNCAQCQGFFVHTS